MGEGAGALVLKRLSDAMADGNTIHAVIRGVGGSSDGRGKGITAPSQRYQIQAIARAYQQAGYDPSTVELVEAQWDIDKSRRCYRVIIVIHLMDSFFSGRPCRSGFNKITNWSSQENRCRNCWGNEGNSLLHNSVIPPSRLETPNPTVDWSNIPFYVPTKATDWVPPQHHPRRRNLIIWIWRN